MKKTQRITKALDSAKQSLIDTLTEFVRKNGSDMDDYYYNEFGIYDEDEQVVKVKKVLDTSGLGIHFARQHSSESVKDMDYRDDSSEIFKKLDKSFEFATYWAFYIVRCSDGTEALKYYCFYNDGACYLESSEPDHDNVATLPLESIVSIMRILEVNF